MHGVPGSPVDIDGDHATSVGGRQHGRHCDVTVSPQRRQPVQLRFDLVGPVVIPPVHAQNRPGFGILDEIRGVLGQIQ
jgi:hypothetical protein